MMPMQSKPSNVNGKKCHSETHESLSLVLSIPRAGGTLRTFRAFFANMTVVADQCRAGIASHDAHSLTAPNDTHFTLVAFLTKAHWTVLRTSALIQYNARFTKAGILVHGLKQRSIWPLTAHRLNFRRGGAGGLGWTLAFVQDSPAKTAELTAAAAPRGEPRPVRLAAHARGIKVKAVATGHVAARTVASALAA